MSPTRVSLLRRGDAAIDAQTPASSLDLFVSWLLGCIDNLYNAFRRAVQARRERWYTRGYGDLNRYYEEVDEWMETGANRDSRISTNLHN